MIRNATIADLPSVKHLADTHKHELGFVINAALKEGISERRLLVAVQPGNRVIGFIHFRHRRDRVTKVYQICIGGSWRRQGYGQALISYVIQQALALGQSFICLSCPEDLLANDFYRGCGFTEDGLVTGRVRRLIQWRLKIDRRTDFVALGRHTCH